MKENSIHGFKILQILTKKCCLVKNLFSFVTECLEFHGLRAMVAMVSQSVSALTSDPRKMREWLIILLQTLSNIWDKGDLTEATINRNVSMACAPLCVLLTRSETERSRRVLEYLLFPKYKYELYSNFWSYENNFHEKSSYLFDILRFLYNWNLKQMLWYSSELTDLHHVSRVTWDLRTDIPPVRMLWRGNIPRNTPQTGVHCPHHRSGIQTSTLWY